MAPDSALVGDFKVSDGSVIHAVVAAKGARGGQQAALSRASATDSSNDGNGTIADLGSLGGYSRRRRFRGVGIGLDGIVLSRRNRTGDDANSDDFDGYYDEEDDDDEDLEAGGRERMGFDQLRATAGLSRSEISALRTYFARSIDQFIEQRRNNNEASDGNGDDDQEENRIEDDPDPEATARHRRLRMEDEWMQAQGPTSEFRLNLSTSNPLLYRRALFRRRNGGGGGAGPNGRQSMDPMYTGPLGTDRDFIWGFCLGYFVGFFMMFWVWMPTVPHRQKLGILTGICFQMAMNIINANDAVDASDE